MAKNRQAPRADAVIDRLRKVAGVASDTALCAYFGLGVSVVSNWRQRGRVPYPECVDLAIRKGISLDWLLLGLGNAPGTAAEVRESAPTGYGDPRITRMVGFLHHWQATRDSDDMAWLERTLVRTVPEYAEWMVSQTTD